MIEPSQVHHRAHLHDTRIMMVATRTNHGNFHTLSEIKATDTAPHTTKMPRAVISTIKDSLLSAGAFFPLAALRGALPRTEKFGSRNPMLIA